MTLNQLHSIVTLIVFICIVFEIFIEPRLYPKRDIKKVPVKVQDSPNPIVSRNSHHTGYHREELDDDNDPVDTKPLDRLFVKAALFIGLLAFIVSVIHSIKYIF